MVLEMNARTGLLVGILISGLALASGCSLFGPDGTKQQERATGQVSVEPPQVSVRTDRALYAPGETILITIQNNLTRAIRYMNGCSLHLCHHVSNEWVCEMKECHGPTTTLEPGDSVEIRHQASAVDGSSQRYRLSYQVSTQDAPGAATSNAFTITQAGVTPKAAVPSASLAQFIEVLESEDYHSLVHEGKEVFTPGLVIPDHATLFIGLTSSEIEQGHIRYLLHSFQGEASAGEIYLIVDQRSGEIIEFNCFEASLER